MATSICNLFLMANLLCAPLTVLRVLKSGIKGKICFEVDITLQRPTSSQHYLSCIIAQLHTTRS